MRRCPKCHKLSVSYDPYKGVDVCMVDDCSCIILDENSFSYLKADISTGTINRIKVVRGHEAEIIKKYRMA